MKIKRLSIVVLLLAAFFVVSSCGEDDEKDKAGLATVVTEAASSITSTTASGGGNVTADGGSTVTARGVCWSTSQNPTTSDSKTTNGTGTGSFTSSITGLSPSTTYYVRAYATNSVGTSYGTQESFTTTGGGGNTVTDIDGNVYHTVQIGTQVWMVENLKTTHYRDGTVIPNITDNSAWSNLTTGAYCDYSNTPSNSTTCGRLYNWYAVNDSRKIAPAGWHVARDTEWDTLLTSCGGSSIAGTKLKSTSGWNSGGNGTNDYGFTALPGGYRFDDGTFDNMGYYGVWWSSTEYYALSAWYRTMGYSSAHVYLYDSDKRNGFSVRCVRDY